MLELKIALKYVIFFKTSQACIQNGETKVIFPFSQINTTHCVLI